MLIAGFVIAGLFALNLVLAERGVEKRGESEMRERGLVRSNTM